MHTSIPIYRYLGGFKAMIKQLTLSLVILSLPIIVNADLFSASEALARGDYDTAAKEFERLAEQGDAKAQAHLGYMYYVGEGRGVY